MLVLSDMWSTRSLAYQLLGSVIVKFFPIVGWMVKVRLMGKSSVGERSSIWVSVGCWFGVALCDSV